jgi:hypothetical protein
MENRLMQSHWNRELGKIEIVERMNSNVIGRPNCFMVIWNLTDKGNKFDGTGCKEFALDNKHNAWNFYSEIVSTIIHK